MEIFYDIIEKGYIHYYNFVIIAALVFAFVFRKDIDRHPSICVIWGALFVVFVGVLCKSNRRIGAAVFDNGMFFIACLGFRFLFLPLAQLYGKVRNAYQKGLRDKQKNNKRKRFNNRLLQRHVLHQKPRQCQAKKNLRLV